MEKCYEGSIDGTCDWNANGYRLPTEAEWEYACRAGTQTDFYSGNITNPNCSPIDSILNLVGWYCGNSYNMTHPVGQKLPNSFGLFDMHGNVGEWVWDSYAVYSTAEQIDPVKFYGGGPYIYRGFGNDASSCRSASRQKSTAGDYQYKNSFVGFRVVRKLQ